MILSLWPTLFDYSFFAPLVLRVVLGIILILSARFKTPDVGASLTSGVRVLGGLLLVLGLFTQAAALALIIYVIVEAVRGKKLSMDYALMLTILLALMLLGPGAYALDLPL